MVKKEVSELTLGIDHFTTAEKFTEYKWIDVERPITNPYNSDENLKRGKYLDSWN